MSLLRSVATISGWTMISRILGFIRDVMIANIIGAGLIADAFLFAFKFPNLFRRLFGEGAMNAAFVPMYAGRLEEKGAEAAKSFAAAVAAILVTFMMFFTILALAAMPFLLEHIVGWSENAEKLALTIALAQITFPYLMFMVLCALLSGMLNSIEKFAHAAAAPVLLNVVFISVLALIHFGYLTMPGYALAYGVALAGAAQFLLLARACHKQGILMPLPRPRLTPEVKHFLKLMAPGVLAAGVIQFNVLIGDMLATRLGEGSFSYLYFADRVNQLALGVIGVAIGVALLPKMSKQVKAGDEAGANGSLNRALELSLFIIVPAAVALVTMPWPIVNVLFQHGEFSANDANQTALALQAYALGLPAYVLIKTLSPGFFAREDTKTPVWVAMGNVALNIALAITLMQFLAHVGIALAVAITAWSNALILAVILLRRGHFQMDPRLKRMLPRLILAAAIMGGSLYYATITISPWMTQAAFFPRIFALAGMVSGGAFLYFAAAQILGAADIREVRGMLRRR